MSDTLSLPKVDRPRPDTIMVGYSDHVSAYRRAIEKKLQKGEIPDILIENGRLIGEGYSPEADAVIGYIRGILTRLSEANQKKPLPPLTIFLADQPDLNAGVITEAKTPILMVNIGTLELFNAYGFGEDHLAGILGHEKFHLLAHKKWKDLSNSRTQEAAGDAYGALELHGADYVPSAMKAFFQKILDLEAEALHNGNYLEHWEERDRERGRILYGLLDVHPSPETRVRDVDVTLAALQLKHRLKETITPIPAPILQSLHKIRYINPIDRQMERVGYAAADVKEKVDLLARTVEETLLMKDEFVLKQRVLTTIPYFKALREDPEAAEPAKAWCDHFLRFAPSVKREWGWDSATPYLWCVEQFLRLGFGCKAELDLADEKKFALLRDGEKDRLIQKADLPDHLRQLERHSADFFLSATREGAVRAARKLVAAHETLKPYGSALYDLGVGVVTPPRWPSRYKIRGGIDTGQFVRLPWEDLVRWALGKGEDGEAGRAESALIKDVAQALSVPDPRLYEEVPYSVVLSIENALEGAWDDLTFDKNGFILDLVPTQKELDEHYLERFRVPQTLGELLVQEMALQEVRDKEEEALLETMDWDDLEKDFWGFVDAHVLHLQPSLTVVSGRHVFAAAFVERMEALLASDPEKWKPLYTAFFSGMGVLPEPGRDCRKDGRHKRYVNSLPDLIARFEERYFGCEQDEQGELLRLSRGVVPEGHPAGSLLSSFAEFRFDREKYRHEYVANGKEWILVKKRRSPVMPKDQQKIEVHVRIDAGHPYVQPVVKLTGRKHWGDDVRRQVLCKFRCEDRNARRPEMFFPIPPSVTFGIGVLEDQASFLAFYNRLDSGMVGSYQRWAVVPLELLKTLKHLEVGPARRFALSKLLMGEVDSTFSFLNDVKFARRLTKELADHVERQVDRNRQIDFDPERDLAELVDVFCAEAKSQSPNSWQSALSYRVFATRPALRFAYEDLIRQRIETEATECEKLKFFSRLTELDFMRPDTKQWAVDGWAEAAARSLGGLDDGSPFFAERAGDLIDDRIYDSAQGLACALALLERVEAQRDLALATKEKIVDHFGRSFMEADLSARFTEAVIRSCAGDDVLQLAFLKFVTEPETRNGNEVFYCTLRQRLSPEASLFKEWLGSPQANRMPSVDASLDFVSCSHQNFWALPFEVRTLLLDRVLFPEMGSDTDAFEASVAYVLDTMLPLDGAYAQESRDVLLTYLDCCPSELRRVTFSALLSAGVQANQAETLRPGQVLSYVLARTGAAGGQILQAIHSYLSGLELDDPELRQLRDDLKSSKVDFDRPLRWEIFERLDEALPSDMKDGIVRVGKILGCGSTAFVVACEKKEAKTAFKLMRKDVLPIADLHFERYRATASLLAQKYPACSVLPSIVDRAVETIKVSTDGDIAAQQVFYAEDLYHRLSVRVNDDVFVPHVASVVSSGAEYLETELVEGQHLHDLSVTTQEEERYRRHAAIALDAMEEYLTALGVAVDEDCHNGQWKLSGSRAGRFDVGAVPFDRVSGSVALPTQAQKKALGKLYGHIINAVVEGASPVDTMTTAVSTMDWGDEKPYLVGLMRARLARMDFYAAFGASSSEKQAVQTAVLKAVWAVGRVDPDLLAGIMETVSLKAGFRLARNAVEGRLVPSRQRDEVPQIAIADAVPLTVRPARLSSLAWTVAKKRIGVYLG